LNKLFPFPESYRNSNLISYADLHRRGNKHVPLTLGRWLKLPNFSIALEHHGFAIRFSYCPPFAGLESSRRASVKSDHSAWRIVQEVAVRFGTKIHAPKNRDRVIRCAYRAFCLELLTHDRGDFVRFLVAWANHE